MMNPRTKQNLKNAMKNDAFDAAQYSRFSARTPDSNWDLAEVFQEVSDIDPTEHRARIAQMESLISSSPDNLRDAIETEMKEAAMSTKFARQAR